MITTIEDFRAWVNAAKGRVVVYFAARGGGAGDTVAAVFEPERGADALFQTLVDEAVKAGKPSRDFVMIERDEKNEATRKESVRVLSSHQPRSEDAAARWEKLAIALITANGAKDAHILEQSKIVSGALVQALDKLGARLAEFEKAQGEMMLSALALANMHAEREQESNASAERRVVWASVVGQLGPAAQSLVAQCFGGNKLATQLEALARSLSPEQFAQLGDILNTPEQKVILDGFVKAKVEDEQKANQVANAQAPVTP